MYIKMITSTFLGSFCGIFIGLGIFLVGMLTLLILSVGFDGLFSTEYRLSLFRPNSSRLFLGIFVYSGLVIGSIIGFLKRND